MFALRCMHIPGTDTMVEEIIECLKLWPKNPERPMDLIVAWVSETYKKDPYLHKHHIKSGYLC